MKIGNGIFSAMLVIAFGLAGMGFFIGDGLRHIKSTDRFVNVRGLAERDVAADTVTFTINFSNSGDSHTVIFPLMEATKAKVLAFLAAKGFKPEEIELGQWNSNNNNAEDRLKDSSIPRMYTNGTVRVRSKNVEAAQQANRDINDLMVQTNGAVTSSEINFEFTGLAPLRAEMIAAATKDARNAALQFAADSGAKVGSIRNASQGIFQITTPGQESDDGRSLRKNVRVVTTVDYELRD